MEANENIRLSANQNRFSRNNETNTICHAPETIALELSTQEDRVLIAQIGSPAAKYPLNPSRIEGILVAWHTSLADKVAERPICGFSTKMPYLGNLA